MNGRRSIELSTADTVRGAKDSGRRAVKVNFKAPAARRSPRRWRPASRPTRLPATTTTTTPTQEIRLKDDRGRLRLPAYVLIALGIALVAITVAILAVLAGFT